MPDPGANVSPFERLAYFPGQFLGVDDWKLEQSYFLQVYRAHFQGQHDWGITADSMTVTAGPGAKNLLIGAGLAIDRFGRQIWLPAATSEAVPGEASGKLQYLTIAYSEALTDPVGAPPSVNYRRITEEPLIEWSDSVPSGDERGLKLVLATVTIAGDGTVSQIDMSTREGTVQRTEILHFTIPNLPEDEQPNLSTWTAANQSAIRVNSPASNFTGNLLATGSLGVGTETPAALLQISGNPPQPGTGKIVGANGNLLTGTGTSFTNELSTGDAIVLKNQQLEIVEATVQRVINDTALQIDQSLEGASGPFTFRKGLLLKVSEAPADVGFTVTAGGYVGLGTDAPNARFQVAGGDIHLRGSGSLSVPGSATLQALNSAHCLTIDSVRQTLGFAEAGTIRFAPSGSTDGIALEADPQSRLALNLDQPEASDRLSVGGVVSTTQGIIFPDGSVQVQSGVSVPVGAIIDWWLPAGDGTPIPGNFRLCDGGAVNLPGSRFRNTPDLRSRFVLGVPQGSITADGNGGLVFPNGGSDAPHDHAVPIAPHHHDITHTHPDPNVQGQTTGKGNSSIDNSWGLLNPSSNPDDHTHAYTITIQGAESPTQNDQPWSDNYPANGSDDDTATATQPSLPPYMDLVKLLRVI